jgi:hypothetical protein
VKRLKRIALVAAVGFLAFAPPGTLIVTFLIVAGVLGSWWFLLGGAGILAAAAALLWLMRGRPARARRSRGTDDA